MAMAIAGAAMIALTNLGCRDKSNTGPLDTRDGGDAGVVLQAKDGGGSEGRALGTDASLPIDDLAMPQPISEELSARMRHLLEAVVQGNSELANDALFPRDAYVSTRDAADPQKAWESKLSSVFRHAVDRTHKRTKGIESAKFVGFELGHAVVQGGQKRHFWKRPLWQVKHSKLNFTIDGKPRHLDIAEMTAWRGAWYVTQLR